MPVQINLHSGEVAFPDAGSRSFLVFGKDRLTTKIVFLSPVRTCPMVSGIHFPSFAFLAITALAIWLAKSAAGGSWFASATIVYGELRIM